MIFRDVGNLMYIVSDTKNGSNLADQAFPGLLDQSNV